MKTPSISNPQQLFRTLSALCVICLLAITTTMNAQTDERTITGVVTSLDGPVEYATVMLKGTTVGVSTDAKGKFTFPKQLKKDDVLLVSFLGYQDDEITIAGDTTFVKPFLKDVPLIIIASLRTTPAKKEQMLNKE